MIDRLQFATSSLVALIAATIAPAACVNTSLGALEADGECAPTDIADSTVVMVEANLEGLGAVRCSGVAISRTFVATARGCVAVPNALHDSYGDPAAAGASTSGNVYYADPVSDPSCEQGNAVEDGSFSTFFGETLPREAFNVYGVSEAANGPGHVFTEVIAPSSSRCAKSLALLRL